VAPAPEGRDHTNLTDVFEIATFRPNDDVTVAEMTALDEQMQVGFVYQQSRLVRRTTGVDGDGGWIVITVWESDIDADAAAMAASTSPIAAAWQAALDPSSVSVRRFHTL
jgi:hypothetical protein